MKTKTMIATALFTAGLGFGAVSSPANAARIKYRNSVPTSLRGTWYHIYGPKDGFHPKFLNQITYYKHSSVSKNKGHVYHSRGKHFVISYFNRPVKFKGYKTKHLNNYFFWNQGDIPAYMSTHLKVAGKMRHVMIETPQNGPFPIYTRFKPSHEYTINGSY